jgi:prepilin-type N-terminal cleavage/methylation domain-containing protein
MQIAKINKQKKQYGFTLIELVVVAAIMMIITAGVLINRQKSFQRKKAESTALQIKSMIDLTRDYALTGEVPPSGNIPNCYSFYIIGTTLKIKTDPTCARNSSLGEDFNNSMTPQTRDSTVTVNASIAISFQVPNGEKAGNRFIKVCGENTCTQLDQVYTITIHPSGATEMQ